MTSKNHTRAILQALLVTLIWASSWILIKISIAEIPPLLFAGLRYSIGVIFLLPALIKNKSVIQKLTGQQWRRLILLGIFFYALTQGGQFLTLQYLETTTFSLLLNFSSIFITVFGIFFLNEKPSPIQWGGLLVFLAGVLLYFSPFSQGDTMTIGYLLAFCTVLANAVSSLLGRTINREKNIPPVVTTGISMGVGAALLMVSGLATEDFPALSLTNWGVIVCLASVNTAFAFTLWNKTLQELSAMESGVLNNAMLIEIALLSSIFLGDTLTGKDWISLLIATAGMVMVNLRGSFFKRNRST